MRPPQIDELILANFLMGCWQYPSPHIHTLVVDWCSESLLEDCIHCLLFKNVASY